MEDASDSPETFARTGTSPPSWPVCDAPGTIRAVRRGAYVMDSTPTTDEAAAHREQIVATVGLLTTSAVVSHMSAAVLRRTVSTVLDDAD